MIKPEHNDSDTPSGVSQDRSGSSSIGLSTQVSGEFRGNDDLTISGHFHGKISLRKNSLLIEKSGKVNAEVTIRNVTIRGKFDGSIQASGRVDIRSGASVNGDIQTARISIEDGAQYKGSIKMQDSSTPE